MRTMIGGFVMTLAVLVALPLAQGGRKARGVVVAAATGRPVANARVKYEEQGRAGQTAVTAPTAGDPKSSPSPSGRA